MIAGVAARGSRLAARDQGLVREGAAKQSSGRPGAPVASPAPNREPRTASREPRTASSDSYEERKRREADARRVKKAADGRRQRIEDLEARIAERENAIKEIEASMSAPGFYENREAAQPLIDRHQSLMWEVGDLMNQWEALQTKL